MVRCSGVKIRAKSKFVYLCLRTYEFITQHDHEQIQQNRCLFNFESMSMFCFCSIFITASFRRHRILRKMEIITDDRQCRNSNWFVFLLIICIICQLYMLMPYKLTRLMLVKISSNRPSVAHRILIFSGSFPFAILQCSSYTKIVIVYSLYCSTVSPNNPTKPIKNFQAGYLVAIRPQNTVQISIVIRKQHPKRCQRYIKKIAEENLCIKTYL